MCPSFHLHLCPCPNLAVAELPYSQPPYPSSPPALDLTVCARVFSHSRPCIERSNGHELAGGRERRDEPRSGCCWAWAWVGIHVHLGNPLRATENAHLHRRGLIGSARSIERVPPQRPGEKPLRRATFKPFAQPHCPAPRPQPHPLQPCVLMSLCPTAACQFLLVAMSPKLPRAKYSRFFECYVAVSAHLPPPPLAIDIVIDVERISLRRYKSMHCMCCSPPLRQPSSFLSSLPAALG